MDLLLRRGQRVSFPLRRGSDCDDVRGAQGVLPRHIDFPTDGITFVAGHAEARRAATRPVPCDSAVVRNPDESADEHNDRENGDDQDHHEEGTRLILLQHLHPP